jgi:hypothetical protein
MKPYVPSKKPYVPSKKPHIHVSDMCLSASAKLAFLKFLI